MFTLCSQRPRQPRQPKTYRAVGFWSVFSWYSSSVRYHYVSLRSIKVSVTNRGLKRAAEHRRPDGELRLSPRSVTDTCKFPPGLPRSDGTSHVLLLYNQGLPRLPRPTTVSRDRRVRGGKKLQQKTATVSVF